MTQSQSVECPTHGDAYTTYVCEHLVKKPVQHWYCDYPTEDNRWPDAWCPKCDAEYLKEGEWSERNEHCLRLKVLCHHCYGNAQASSIDWPAGRALKAWTGTVRDCQEHLHEKQEKLASDYALSEHERWDVDQATGLLTFSNGDVPAVIAEVEYLGSISTRTGTWLWSWGNLRLLPNVRTRAKAVREYGESKRFPRLTVSLWPAELVDAWEVSSVAVEILGAQGVYRTPSPNGYVFMALMNIRAAR